MSAKVLYIQGSAREILAQLEERVAVGDVREFAVLAVHAKEPDKMDVQYTAGLVLRHQLLGRFLLEEWVRQSNAEWHQVDGGGAS